MLPRVRHEASVRDLLRMFPVVGLIGARQVGKTTLARVLIRGERQPVTFFDLEDPTDEATLADPRLALESLRGLVVIDEVQRKEGLFSISLTRLTMRQQPCASTVASKQRVGASEGLTVHQPNVHGSRIPTPILAKSLVLRVAKIRLCRRATAAICASAMGFGRPSRSPSPMISPQITAAS